MGANVALVVAAGRGHRTGAETPKQYLDLGGRAILRHSLDAFLGHGDIDAVAVVIRPEDRALYEAAVKGLGLPVPVAGGATRRESVLRGLESLEAQAPERVLIHDAARPFIDSATIGRVLAALDHAPGAIAAVPVADTLKRAAEGPAPNGHVPEGHVTGGHGPDGIIAATVDRAGLWRAQTPQGFRFADILAAHRAVAAAAHQAAHRAAHNAGATAGDEPTDDAAVAERAGLAVTLVMGSEDNFKVTTEEDIVRARHRIGAAAEIRTGFGLDAHRFTAGDHLWLCGVRIAHDKGLKGHSDADVGLHAATDALLGAIGAGDIGDHFPPDDERWRGASSALFLEHAGRLIAARGGKIANLDLTLVCEAPRIGPHRGAMTARIAEILGLEAGRVSVKATTTEKMGFTGRGEGIAAQAVATVRLPPVGL